MASNTALTWLAESLNDYAEMIERGEDAPGHTPSAPGYWFDGLARELVNLRGTSWEDLLAPAARGRFLSVTSP